MEKGQYPLLFLLRFVRCGVSYCGAVAPRVTAALLGRFLPRLGPLASAGGPFFFVECAPGSFGWRYLGRAHDLLSSCAVGVKLLNRDVGQAAGEQFEIGSEGGE